MSKILLVFLVIVLLFVMYNVIIVEYQSYVERTIGDKYENLVFGKLRKIRELTIIRNVIMPSNDSPIGETEADMICVSKKGIFAIECKYRKIKKDVYECNLYASTWGPKLHQNSNFNMSNPFTQNNTHISAIKKIMDTISVNTDNIFNVVCLSCPFEFNLGDSILTSKKSKNFLFYPEFNNKILLRQDNSHNGVKVFAKTYSDLPDVYTDEEINNLISILNIYAADKEKRKNFSTDMYMYNHGM